MAVAARPVGFGGKTFVKAAAVGQIGLTFPTSGGRGVL